MITLDSRGVSLKDAFLLCALVALAADSPPSPSCYLARNIAIGCIGGVESAAPENAADLFATYGFDAVSIRRDNEFIRRHFCLTVRDQARSIIFRRVGATRVPVQGGSVVVRYVQVAGGADPARKPFLWIADEYIRGVCPPLEKTENTNVPSQR